MTGRVSPTQAPYRRVDAKSAVPIVAGDALVTRSPEGSVGSGLNT